MMSNKPTSPPPQGHNWVLYQWLLVASFSLMCFLDCGPRGPQLELLIIEGGHADQIREPALPEPSTHERTAEPPHPRDTRSPEQREPVIAPEQESRERAPDASLRDHFADASPTPDTTQERPIQPLDQVPDLAPRPDLSPLDRGPPPDYVGTPCQVSGVAGTCKPTQDCTGDNQATPGHCPGPPGIQCCTPKRPPTSGCDPNARPQPNRGLTEAPGQGGCKAGMLRIASFCIDQYEASLVELLPNGTTRPWSPYFNPGQTKVRALSIKGAVPQGYISGDQAANACKEAGKRLCTDNEWLRACQSTNKYTYPYGNTRQPGVCNDARSKHPAVEYFKSSAQWVFGKIQHQCLNQLPASLAKTGSKVGCTTVEKVYDMMGNLHEWTAASSGIFRGGFYVDTYRNGNGCLYRTTAHNTLHWDYSTGFRCCATP